MTFESDAEVFPTQGTASLERFYTDHVRLMGFVAFVAELATRADDVVRIARKALAEGEEEHDFSDLDEGGALARFRRNRQLILEMVLTRGVDNFLVYLSELLSFAYRAQPMMLLSRLRASEGHDAQGQESVPLAFVLEHTTIEELVDALVERRINALAYRSVRDLHVYLEGQLGLRLFESEDDLTRAVELIEQRNLIAHSRGRVNRIFLSRVPNPNRYTLGQELVLVTDEVFGGVHFLAMAAAGVDERAASKWHLKTASFGTPGT